MEDGKFQTSVKALTNPDYLQNRDLSNDVDPVLEIVSAELFQEPSTTLPSADNRHSKVSMP